MPAALPPPVFCAVDTPDLAKAEALAHSLLGKVHGLKLGLEFFLAHGMAGYTRIAATGVPIFLDLKLHDIPNTVGGGITSLLAMKPAFTTIHTSGGPTMMRLAAEAAAKAGASRPKILGVTVLTSMDERDLGDVGQDSNTTRQVIRLTKLAKESGLDGVICSPEEIKPLRAAMGADFILMVPGIRPTWAAANDQKRIMTPREAVDAGATYLVIGRPITGAENPADAAQRIAEEISA